MNKYNFIWVAAVLGLTGSSFLTSCNDMELEPKGMLAENTLLKSDEGIKRYLALIYQDCPIEDYNYGQGNDLKGYAVSGSNGWHPGNQWQAQKSSQASCTIEGSGRNTGFDNFSYAAWDRIHDINNFIEQLPNYQSGEKLEEYIAEGRFLRAFYYFGMIKREGGMPIIDHTLSPTGALEDIELPRDTEYDCWMFIHDDLEYAMEHGTSTRTPGRFSKYAAAALMSRAMLYAGTIAKYTHYIFEQYSMEGPAITAKLQGIDPEHAKEFFKYSYDACKFLQQAGFTLHNGANAQAKEEAFAQALSEEVADEDIFVKQYTQMTDAIWDTSAFHMWDMAVLPKIPGLAGDLGMCLQPSWELADMFEHPAIEDENGRPIRFDSQEAFWQSPEMEPRLKATMFFSGMTESLSGVKIDLQRGVYKSFPGTVADANENCQTVGRNINNAYVSTYRVIGKKANTLAKDTEDPEVQQLGSMVVTGSSRAGKEDGDENFSHTGLVIRKMVQTKDAKSRTGFFLCYQPWKVFRYGEILCNWAEAAYELGLETGNDALKQEAIEHVNELRERAGAHPYTYKAAPELVDPDTYGFDIDENLQYIRDERVRELCFENQIGFDYRRWRVYHQLFRDGKWKLAICPYYVMDEDKYIFIPEVNDQGRKTNEFGRGNYYSGVPGRDRNSKLIPNV